MSGMRLFFSLGRASLLCQSGVGARISGWLSLKL